MLHLLLYIDANFTLQVLEFLRSLSIANYQLDQYTKYVIIEGEYVEMSDFPKKFMEENLSTRYFANASIPSSFFGKNNIIFYFLNFVHFVLENIFFSFNFI